MKQNIGRMKYRLKNNIKSKSECELRSKISLTQNQARRISQTDIPDDKSRKVMSPLEAQKKVNETFGVDGVAFKRQAIKSKRLKARRTLALSPAPKPITANKNAASTLFANIKKFLKSHIKKIDFIFLLSIIVLAILGILAVHSATHYMGRKSYDFKQTAAFFAGLILIIIMPAFDYAEILKRGKWIFLINTMLLLYTFFFGFSPENSGSTNNSWISLGFTSVQPAEFAKILFILSLSAHLEKVHERINNVFVLLGVLLHGCVIIGLVLAEKDMGNALVFIAIFVSMLFCAKIDIKYILGCLAASIVAFPLLWDNLGDFRKRRVLIGFNPELDPQGFGHQVIRSRNAIASGGLLGQGYMKGETVQKAGALFGQHTDMIFAVIGQEFGFIGCVILITAFALLVSRILKTAKKSRDYAGTYICAGVAGMLIFQFTVNVGMALGMTPVVGITLPLVSYGTSSLICMYVSLAFIMSVYANSKNYAYKAI